MKKFLTAGVCLFLTLTAFCKTIIVKNIEQLREADKKALPGDQIILQNGEWKDVVIKLTCKGTKEKPISFKAQTPGKVLIRGNSRLAIGGEWIVVSGLLFRQGFSGDKAVIEFRASNDELANNCRVTSCAIDDFNNTKRLDENYWVAFYGKNNRIDHCTFKDKKNIGVLLAVILDDDRSRENYHRIDHNYFGKRIPLASNGGEIIRVGVSQHCEFNSNTQITDNFFEHCDGETEIVSIKSGSNLVKGNLFRECQGGVVLRHGNFNTVENNIFLGNNKPGTGGVRVINKGQWVVNNFFYKCRGVDFRSPLSIMNGIPNSPANRYVQVTDAVIANNTFMECSAISFCEGSDSERTLPPDNVLLFNNLFYNTRDTSLFNVYDNIEGFRFEGNELNSTTKNKTLTPADYGFAKRQQKLTNTAFASLPLSLVKGAVSLRDSLRIVSAQRLGKSLSTKPGFGDVTLLNQIQNNAIRMTGARWLQPILPPFENIRKVNCTNAEDLTLEIEKNKPVIITLTGKTYHFTKPLEIKSIVYIISNNLVDFSSEKIKSIFSIDGGGNLSFFQTHLDGRDVKAESLVSSAETGSSAHYNFSVTNSSVKNLDRNKGCLNFFRASKSIVADSILVHNSLFTDNKVSFFMMDEEKDDKGYYNAEKISFFSNNINNQEGTLLTIYRGGNDESTMGPKLIFSHNQVTNCNDRETLFHLTGVQTSDFVSNTFTSSNKDGILIKYSDKVRARHQFTNNLLHSSGKVEGNQFLKME